MEVAASDNEDNHPAANGWTIANESRQKSNSSWSGLGQGRTAMLHVAANHAELDAGDFTTTRTTLTLTQRAGNWWVKRTAPSAGNCAAGESDYSHSVSGLVKTTNYTYKAYSDSSCTVEIASENFRTLSPGDRNAKLDFNTADNNSPHGIWSNGVTMWVARWVFNDESNSKLYAYKMSDKSRDSSKDFNTLVNAGNEGGYGIWSDGATMWVADYRDNHIYAYKMTDKTRDTSKEFNTLSGAGNTNPYGIWSDGTTMWVADYIDDKIFAYKMSDKSRDASKEFNTLSGAGNNDPTGIWSDGTTMWVADLSDEKLYAYKMSDKTRDTSKDFNAPNGAGNDNPRGIWSDGMTMWVADDRDDKVYAYWAFP